MSDARPETHVDSSAGPGENQDIRLDLNFVPDWARVPANKNPYRDHKEALSPRGRDDRGRGPRRHPGDRGKPDRRDDRSRRSENRGERDRGTGRRGRRDEKPARQGEGERAPDRRGARGRSGPPRGQRDERRAQASDRRPASPLPLDVAFLPEREKLGAVVRRLQQERKAYPLMELANLFIRKPDHHRVKLQARKGEHSKDSFCLYQCKATGDIFLDRQRMIDFLLHRALDQFFEVEEVEGEVPSGRFVCVGCCTLTGELLGPPNHHAFQDKIQEMVATRFPHLSQDEYREKVRIVHDEEVVEAWKTQQKKKVVYRLVSGSASASPTPQADENCKNQPVEPLSQEVAGEEERPAPADLTPDVAPMTRSEAIAYAREHLIPQSITSVRRTIISSHVAQQVQEHDLKHLISDAWHRESRFPFSLSLALRPALRHMGLHLFKADRKRFFVSAIPPKPLDPGTVVESIRKVIDFLEAHPGCHRQDLAKGIGGDTNESFELQESLQQLRWLIDKGHLIEFFDGTLALPRSTHAV